MSNPTTTRAAEVSRILREGGLRPLPSGTRPGTPGVRVTTGYLPNKATVWVDIDVQAVARRRAASIAEYLTAVGYTVDPNPYDPTILEVSVTR